VLKKVGEAGFARLFVLGADVIPDVQRDDGRFMIFMDDNLQTIVQNELFARNFELGKLHGGVKPSR
jgi:hypothetical protein